MSNYKVQSRANNIKMPLVMLEPVY